MTQFEQFAQEIGVKITYDRIGLYSGMACALASMTNDVILSDDEEVFNLSWEEQKEIIKERFFKTFEYMRK